MLGQTLLGRYKLTRILGAGGFGQTYLAVDTRHPRRQFCVVKQLKPASQDANFLSVARRLFETEAKILGELGDHPQIPHLLDSFEEDHEFYLVQEYIDGQSLEEEIKQAGQFSEAQIVRLLEAVLPVLDFIHQHHVLHRDLKPDNLIRRRESGELVLIDFGAVKEIRTRLITGERSSLTIGIGTQGYTPSEQLAGKPRYSSDIYALGMTAIHALTGRSPTDLPETMGSLEPCWEGYAQISPGLAILLGKMTRHYIYQRYQNVAEVKTDLGRLDELTLEASTADTFLETSLPYASLDTEGKTEIVRWRMGRKAKYLTAAIACVLTSAAILGARQFGFFVSAELVAYDALVRARPDKGPDPRLLLVEITEDDLKELGTVTPADGDLAQVIDNLQGHQPARIAVDLLRDQPEGEGGAALAESLRDPNVVVITKLPDASNDAMVPPPPNLTFEQLSFSNVPRDEDFRVRRSQLLAHLSRDFVEGPRGLKLGGDIGNSLDSDPLRQPIFSLGAELAIRYLEHYRDIGPADGEILQLGSVRFEPMSPNFGGYQHADTAGYQLMMNYRSPNSVARRLSFEDVLNNRFDPKVIKNKIVIIGSTAENSRDTFLTPFNANGNFEEMHGIEIHAQVASQILSAVIDGEPLPWAWPEWAEIVWIVALTGLGGTLMVLTQRGPILIIFGVGGLALAAGVGIVAFQAGGWVPIAAPMAAFFLSAAGARISKSYQRRYWEAHQGA